jgi:3-oxoacyl-[acyl-carrier-protein] synthase II
MNMSDSVVITGVGLAVPGLTGPLDLLAAPGARSSAGFDPQTELAGRHMRHKDRASRLALRSVEFALIDAGLGDSERYTGQADRTAIAVSSNLGSLDSVCEFVDVIADRSVLGLSPLGLPKTSSNVIAGAVAIQYRMRGPNLTLCNGATSGLDAVYWGQVLLASGRAEVVVVIGVEPSSDIITKFVGAETVDGAAALVLERAEHAAARQANQRARIVGYSRRSDPADAVCSAQPGACVPFALSLADTAYSPSAASGSTLDIQSSLGECSGALGVLQAVAAVAHFDAGGAGPVVAVNATSSADAAAALVMCPPDVAGTDSGSTS